MECRVCCSLHRQGTFRGQHGLPPRFATNCCSEHHDAAGGLPPTAAAAATGADGTVVVGSLANSYATYQLRLSGALAREHHELRSAELRCCRGKALACASLSRVLQCL